jgi:hypothetical protein
VNLMRVLAAAAALGSAVSYLALLPVSPLVSLFGPRGGIVTLAMSMVLANGLIWMAGHPGRSARTRFELAAAG